MPPPPVDAVALCRAWRRHALLLPARGVGRDRAGADRARARHGRDRHRRPQHAGRRGADAQRVPRARGCRPLIGCRLDLDRCAEPARLSDRPRRLWPAVAAAQPGQDAGRQRRVRAQRWPTSREHAEGIAFIAWPDDDLDAFEGELPRLRDALPSLRHVAATLALSRRRHCADRAARPASRGRTAARSSPPTTSIITRPSGGRCRTS